MDELVKIIESQRFSSEFYVHSNTTSLLQHWISTHPAVRSIAGMLDSDRDQLEDLSMRALKLLRSPVEDHYRSEFEAAICCYAYVLSRPRSELSAAATAAMNEFEQNAGPRHGALRRLLDRILGNTSSVQFDDLLEPPRHIRMLESRSSVTTDPPLTAIANGTFLGIGDELWSTDEWIKVAA